MNSAPAIKPSEKVKLSRFSLLKIARRIFPVVILTCLGLFGLSMTSSPPTTLGVNNDKLSACPESPNCVSTQAVDPEKKMETIPFTASQAEMISKIKNTVESNWPRATLVSETDHYLHYEFKSFVFRFIDDVEFFVNDESSEVHFRSASRVGHSDLGVNRKRMNQVVESLKP
ncbi:MAG: DUF1499 domain-containing protein [Mariniblastus sp.]|nr:DUF1499 domain-containing protein [Mariniblastus sp.]